MVFPGPFCIYLQMPQGKCLVGRAAPRSSARKRAAVSYAETTDLAEGLVEAVAGGEDRGVRRKVGEGEGGAGQQAKQVG